MNRQLFAGSKNIYKLVKKNPVPNEFPFCSSFDKGLTFLSAGVILVLISPLPKNFFSPDDPAMPPMDCHQDPHRPVITVEPVQQSQAFLWLHRQYYSYNF